MPHRHTELKRGVIVGIVTMLICGCSTSLPVYEEQIEQEDLSVHNLTLGNSVWFVLDDSVLCLRASCRTDRTVIVLEEIGGSSVLEVDAYDWTHENDGAKVSADTLRPVAVWDDAISFMLRSQFGDAVVLEVDAEKTIREVWRGRTGADARLAYVSSSASLMLAGNRETTLIDRSGVDRLMDLPVEVAGASELGAGVALIDARDDSIFLYPEGERLTRRWPRSRTRWALGIGSTLVLSADGPMWGRERIETITIESEQAEKWRRLSLDKGVWHHSRVGASVALWRDGSDSILLVDGETGRRVKWEPPVNAYRLCWSASEHEVVAVYDGGYSRLNLVGDVADEYGAPPAP